MRKVIATLCASVDGFAADAPDAERAAFALEQVRQVDTLLLGRKTYEIMAAHFPTAGDDDGGCAELMNRIPKVVFSRTLDDDDISWSNARLARGGLTEEVASLKGQPGGDIGISGSVELVHSLMRLGLIDVLRLGVHLDSRVVAFDYEPHTNGKETR